jgi:uncharacterized protein
MHPLPNPDSLDAPFWAALAAGRFEIQRCAACEAWQHPPRPQCVACGDAEHLEWAPASGAADLHTFTICHPPVLPAFADRVPYVAAVVRLAEGPFLVTNIVDPVPEPLVIGAPCRLSPTSVASGEPASAKSASGEPASAKSASGEPASAKSASVVLPTFRVLPHS